MVFLTKLLEKGFRNAKKVNLPRKYLRRGFLDHLKLVVAGGTGGEGLPKFGGIGGKGGDVIFMADRKTSLGKLAMRTANVAIRAGNGGKSHAKGLIGDKGRNLTVRVPEGIAVYDQEGPFIGEIHKAGSKLIVAKGGLGGCQETGYSGQKGERRFLYLDLKLIADIALVGFPNAGKSTMLNAISNANPRIASYPFTTLQPHLGTIEYKDFRKITVADLPGLIEGAHENVGQGYKFLKHVTRCKFLVYIVDIGGFQLSAKHPVRSCMDTIVLLNKEVELYSPDLLDNPAILIINKMDTDNAMDKYKEVMNNLENYEKYLEQCPDEWRPEKPLIFEEIVKTSFQEADSDDIRRIKNLLRTYLDKRCTLYVDDLRQGGEEEMLKKLKRQVTQIAPTVV